MIALLSRPLVLLGLAAAALGMAYLTGRDHAADRWRSKLAKAEAARAEVEMQAMRDALARGADTLNRIHEARKEADNVNRYARRETGSGDLCISDATAERLRDLRARQRAPGAAGSPE